MDQMTETLIQLVGNEVCGNPLCLPSESPYSEKQLTDMFITAREHKLVHIAASALEKNKILGTSRMADLYREQVYAAVFKYENINYVLQQVCDVLEANKIPYIPLKGAVIKELYPQAWMRSCIDIDILVPENASLTAACVITETLGYEKIESGDHDITFQSPENICIELHFSLLEKDNEPKIAKVLGKVWDYAVLCNPDGCRFGLKDEFFYFYHIAHMAKHFVHGGCGIRPFLDLWLIEHNIDYDESKVNDLLSECGLLKFAEYTKQLSEVWFSGSEHNRTTMLMQEYIINGGMFGSVQNRFIAEEHHNGGKVKFFLSKIFVPYRFLKNRYPILKKYKFLLPFFEIYRLISLLFGKNKPSRKTYFTNQRNVPAEGIHNINELFDSVGL